MSNESSPGESTARASVSNGEEHPVVHPSNYIGRHRMIAAITSLNQEVSHIQDELDQLQSFGQSAQSSSICKEVLLRVESVPDPLLPITKGSVKVDWDRWFQGVHGSRIRKRWIR